MPLYTFPRLGTGDVEAVRSLGPAEQMFVPHSSVIPSHKLLVGRA